MRNNCLTMLVIALAGCGAGDGAQKLADSPQPHLQMSQEQPADWLVDPIRGSFGVLTVGMPKGKLAVLGLPIKWGQVEEEGDLYETATVSVTGDITVNCVLSDGLVYRCSSESEGLRDHAGMGIGSTLRELRRAYPQGRILVGSENGRYANFVMAGPLMFSMDLSSIKDSCFELEDCELDEDALRVIRIVITNV